MRIARLLAIVGLLLASCLAPAVHATAPVQQVLLFSGQKSIQTWAAATRLIIPDSSTSNKSANVTDYHVATSNYASGVVACAANFTIANAAVPGETAVGGTLQVAMAIEYPLGTTPTPLKFNGSRQSAATTATYICSDPSGPLPVAIPKGSKYMFHMWLNNSAGLAFSNFRDNTQDFTHVSATTETDLTLTPGFVTGNLSTTSIHPVIIAVPTKDVAVADVGDSIGLGVKTTWDAVNLRNGIVGQSIPTTIPFLNLASSGEQCALWSSNAPARNFLIKFFPIVTNEMGTNDVHVGGSSAATLSACQGAMISRFTGKHKVILTTLLAEPTSTRGWTDSGHQTTDTAQTTLDDYNNNYVKKNAVPGASGIYFDTASVVQTAGIWNTTATARSASDCSMSSTVNPTRLASSSTITFVTGDIGSGVWVQGAGVSGADLGTNSNAATVASIFSGTTATLNTGANTTVGPALCAVGSLVNDGIHPNDAGLAAIKASGIIDSTKLH